jgi:hypothetical protein
LVFVDDKADTTRRTAAAGMQAPFGVGETVIESEFFAGGDVAARDDPDVSVNVIGLAIGRAGMVDQAGNIAGRATVKITELI